MAVLLLTGCTFGEHWEVPVTSNSAVLTHIHRVGVPQQSQPQSQHFYNALSSRFRQGLAAEWWRSRHSRAATA